MGVPESNSVQTEIARIGPVRLAFSLSMVFLRSMTSQSIEGYFVYVLLSLKDKRFYVGYTENVEKRLLEHEQGRVTSTKYRKPLKLLHYEFFANKADAKAREVFLKSGFGREQLRLSLKRTLTTLL